MHKISKLSGLELIGIGIGLLGLGITLVTFQTTHPFIEIISVEETRKTGFIIIILALIAFLIAIGKLIRKILKYISFRLSGTAILEPFLDFEVSDAVPADIQQIHSLGNAVIGDYHATDNQLLSRIQKCPQIIKKLTSSNLKDNNIKGYYIFYPLTSQGIKRIDTCKIVSGKSLENSDISTNFRNARAVYISMIFGNNLMSKAAALLYLKYNLKYLRETNHNISKIYAKPSTTDGLRLLKKYGFFPIAMETGIWVLKF